MLFYFMPLAISKSFLWYKFLANMINKYYILIDEKKMSLT